MKIHLNFNESRHSSITPVVVVIIRSNKKEKILYHSGLQYFCNEEAKDLFVKLIREQFGDINLEIHEVDVVKAHAPEDPELKVKGKYWCPYCQGYHKFKNWGKQYLRCPICGMSDADFWVRKYNNLWSSAKIKLRRKKK